MTTLNNDDLVERTNIHASTEHHQLTSRVSAYQEVSAVLQTYFDAIYEASASKIEHIFHPKAVYATADQEPSLIWNLPTYLKVMECRESPESRHEERRDYVASIEFAGDNTVFAKVGCSIGSSDFIDFLTLIREHNKWKIISKVFQIIEQEEG